MPIAAQRRATPDMSSFVASSGLISGASPTMVKRKHRSPSSKLSPGVGTDASAVSCSAATLTTSASSPCCRRTRTSMPSPLKSSQAAASSSSSPPPGATTTATDSTEVEAARVRQYHNALAKDLHGKLEQQQQLSTEELSLLQSAIIEIQPPSWEEERDWERREGRRPGGEPVPGTGDEEEEEEEGGEGSPSGEGKLPKIDPGRKKGVARIALTKMAAAAAETNYKHREKEDARLAIGDNRGAPTSYSLVNTLSAKLLPQEPDGTPAVLKAFKDSDFKKPGQGPGPPAQRWLNSVAAEAAKRMEPQRRRVDHEDILAPLNRALAMLRNECEAHDAEMRRRALQEGRPDGKEYHAAREQLSRSARGSAMEWKRVLERAQLYASAHGGLVPRVGLLDASLGMAMGKVFAAYAEEMRIFPEITRRKAKQLARAEAKMAGLEADVKRAEAEAEEARTRLAESEGARGFIQARGHKRDMELIDLKRTAKQLEMGQGQTLEQLTHALTKGREAAAQLQQLHDKKNDTFQKTLGLRNDLEEVLKQLREAEGRGAKAVETIQQLEDKLEVAGRSDEHEIRRLTRELTEAKATLAARETSLARERAAAQARSELLEKREVETQELHEQVAAARLKQKDAELELSSQKRKYDLQAANLEQLNKRSMALGEDNHVLREQLLQLRSQQRDAEAALHDAQHELKRVKGGEAAAWLVNEGVLLAEVAAMEATAGDAARADAAEAQLAAAQAAQQELHDSQFKQEAALEQLQHQLRTAEEERDNSDQAATAAMDSAAVQQADAAQRVAAAMAELTPLKQRAEAAEAKLTPLQAELEARQQAEGELEQYEAELKQQLENLEGENTRLRAQQRATVDAAGGDMQSLVQRVTTDASVLVGALYEVELEYGKLAAHAPRADGAAGYNFEGSLARGGSDVELDSGPEDDHDDAD